MSEALSMPPIETVEAVVRVVLREHYKGASWAWGRRGWAGGFGKGMLGW